MVVRYHPQQGEKALALLSEFKFDKATKCYNFDKLWDHPRFKEIFGEADPREENLFWIEQTNIGIVGQKRTAKKHRKRAPKMDAPTAKIGQRRRCELQHWLKTDRLLAIKCVSMPVDRKRNKEWLVLETENAHALNLALPPWPDRRNGNLEEVVRGPYEYAWRRGTESTVDLLKGVGIKVEAMVLLKQEGEDMVAALIAKGNGRRAMVTIDGVDATSLALEAKGPLLITESLAQKLYVRGKTGKPLSPKSAQRRLLES